MSDLRERVARVMRRRLDVLWGNPVINHDELTELADAAIAFVLAEAAKVAEAAQPVTVAAEVGTVIVDQGR